MKITREDIVEAIKLSKDILPKFTAFEMARIIGVPVKYLLRAIQANIKNFKFDAEKNIIGLDSTNHIQNINSNEVWGWYLKNRLKGDANACLTISDQQRLMASLNSRVKWDLSFGLVAATFASQEISGADVRTRVAKTYSNELTGRLVKLGTVSGSGQIPDRYVFGITLTEGEIAARKLHDFPLYSPEWAMEEMMDEVDWVEVDVPDLHEVKTVPYTVNVQTKHEPAERQAAATIDPRTAEKILAGAGGSKPPVPGIETRTRRTKEKIADDLKAMVNDLISRSLFTQEEIDTVAKAEKITDAEKAYKVMVAHAENIERAEKGLPGQQQIQLTDPATDKPVDEVKSAPVEPAQVFTPVVEKTMQFVPPSLNSAPTRPTMPKLSDLEGVPSIKASIRADAGAPPPPSVSTAPTAVQPVAQMGFQHQAPPIAHTPPPAGASVSAENLLNDLLRATGQVGG